MSFNVKKFISGFNLMDGEARGKLYYHILVTALVLWVSWFILNKATEKTDTENITVESGGVAHITHLEQKDRSPWSVGGYIETRTQEFDDATLGIRVDYHF